MEQEYTIEFEVRFRTKVKCKPEDLQDAVTNVNIPENDETEYVEDTVELHKIENADGEEVDEEGNLI